MPQAIIILYDNSDYMRNGDYSPNRKVSEIEAVNCICDTSCNRDPETTIGLVSMAGLPSVPQSLVKDNGHINSAVCKLPLSGSINLISSIHIAKLALSHREPKHAKQRIIAFVGSPLLPKTFSSSEDKKSFEEKLKKQLAAEGATLRKEGIQLDIISFGEIEMNKPFLSILNRESSGGDPTNGTFLEIMPNSEDISNKIICSPIIDPNSASAASGSSAAAAPVPGPNSAFADIGVDPNEDPELYAAIMASLEDQRQQTGGDVSAGAGMDEEEELQKALAESLQPQQTTEEVKKEEIKELNDISMGDDMDDETALLLAIEMSKRPEFCGEQVPEEKEESKEEKNDEMKDEEEDEDKNTKKVLENAMKSLIEEEEKEEEKKKEKKDKKDKKDDKDDSDMKD